MPRRRRYWGNHACYHITHRCHGRRYLFRFAKYRESNRFHATWVQSGVHLRRCLFYIDMNMVRAGVVEHPAQWRHSSAYELASSRKRYRVVDRERLLERLELPDWRTYEQWYKSSLADILARELFRTRQGFWSESVAVGSAGWLARTADRCGMKRYDLAAADAAWSDDLKSFFVCRKKAS